MVNENKQINDKEDEERGEGNTVGYVCPTKFGFKLSDFEKYQINIDTYNATLYNEKESFIEKAISEFKYAF